MRIWALKYKCSTEDGEETSESLHETEESAERAACDCILDVGLPQMDETSSEHQDIAVAFLAHVQRGDFGLALQGYRKAIDEGAWEEEVLVEEHVLHRSEDSDVMAKAARQLSKWSVPRPEEDAAEE